jgi:hypothetical protein
MTVSHAISARPGMHARDVVRDEYSSRRDSFRAGNEIRLADGQTWTLPAPPTKSEAECPALGTAYTDIIHAILEAEDRPEQTLGELAFAVYLLEQNYHLTPADYRRLLATNPTRPSTNTWQASFHQIAQEHLHAFLDFSHDQSEN